MKQSSTTTITLYIAGSYDAAVQACREWCRRGGCVTVTRTMYVYTGGAEDGVAIGFINYPPYPKEPADLLAEAESLASLLIDRLVQTSYTIVTPATTYTVGR